MTDDLWCRGVSRERMFIMPKAYPKEFRDDVVRVAQQREEGVTVKQVAKDFGDLGVVSDELDDPGRPGR